MSRRLRGLGRKLQSLLFLGLVGVILGLLYSATKEPSLLARAHPVVRVQDWDFTRSGYLWIAPDRLVLFREAHRYGGTLFCYNTTTRQSVRMAKLTERIEASAGSLSSLRVSPDGRKVLWTTPNGEIGCAANWDGSDWHSWELKPGYELRWLENTKMVGLPQSTMEKAQSHLDSKDNPIAYLSALPPAQESVYPSEAFGADCILGDSYHASLARTSSGREQQVHTVRIVRWSLNAGPSPVCTYIVSLPYPATILDMAYSVQGDQVAWLLCSEVSNPIVRLLQRLFSSSSQSERRASIALWVSKLDGSQMRRVGSLSASESAVLLNGSAPELRWLPGDASLSLLSADTLFTLRLP